ncbi:MAG: hypothetical protein V4850_27960 [Myxococcota bacterium]
MNLSRSTLSALALFVAVPLVAPLVGVGTAEAANIVLGSKVKKDLNGNHYRISTLVAEDTSGAIETVTAEVSSDVGRETARLTESDAWLHGAAPLASRPTADAELSLTLYDRASASLIVYSGTVGADGSLALEADAGAPVCTRLGCTYPVLPDIALLAAEVFASTGGYELSIDLSGSAAHDVAYAKVFVTPCDITAATGICLYDGRRTTTAEVDWDTIGTVWEAELALDHEGPVDVKVKVRADEGPTEVLMSSLGLPWLDGGDGVSTLAADEDPLTTVGLMEHDGATALAVVSDGWTLATAPTSAAVVLETGETITIPANSYQRRGGHRSYHLVYQNELSAGARLRIDGATVIVDRADPTFADLSTPLCVEGTCVQLVGDDEDGYGLAVTQYRWDTAFPTDEVHVSLAALDADGAETVLAEGVVTFDDEVTVVFANEVGFAADPLRTALAGRVTLGRDEDRLASGRFFSKLDRQASGALGLAGVGVDDVARADTSFAVLLQGERTSCGNDDDGFTAVPPLMATFGNGSGTKNASSQTSIRPQLL